MTDSAIPSLFKWFPDLQETVGWLDLGLTTAPIQKIDGFAHPGLWIRRNDLISEVYGGNKVGRLEFILADVTNRKYTHVVTLGGIGSNHCLAVAIFCKRLGIRCTLCLFEQPVTGFVRENLLLFQYYGAELHFVPGILKSAFAFYSKLKSKYPQAYFLEAGGASELGILGAINSALEFKEQVDKGVLPEPDYLFCATASNCGMAGLSFGFLLSGMKTTVIGVRTGRRRMGPVALNTPGSVKKKMIKTFQFLRDRSTVIKSQEIPTPVLTDDYFGEGYGFPTVAGEQARHLFQETLDIRLEPVYTAKTCAALLDAVRKPEFTDKTVLYWHTCNSVDFSATAAALDYRHLPSELHYCFQSPEPDV